MKKNNGFTLVELLAVIIILAAILLIIIPLITNNVREGSEVADVQNKDSIVLSSRNWGSDNKNYLPDDGGEICVSVKALIDEGYLDNDIEDQYRDGSVLITNTDGAYYYNYQDKSCSDDLKVHKTITFDYKENGGTGSDVTMEVIPGKTVNLPDGDGTKSGWEFVGWNNNKNAHSGFDSYTMPNSDVTLYAIYKKTVKATFEIQNDEISEADKDEDSCTMYNKSTSCSVKAAILTSVPGSEVIGWNSNKNANTAEVRSGAIFNLSNNKTFYAIVEITDHEAPECTLSISSGKPGNNNWYVSDVGVHMEARDIGEAGLKQYGLTTSSSVTYNSVTDITHKNDVKSVTYNGYVRDGVGNTSKCSITFKKDATAPTITSVTNSSNSNWTNKDVTISAKATDVTSGMDQIYYYYGNDSTKRSNWKNNTPTSVSGVWTSNQNRTVYIYAVDNAGNTTTRSAGSVKIDKTAPTCSIAVTSGTKGLDNWYTSNVGMRMTKSDTGGSTLSQYGLTTNTTATYNSLTTATQTNDTKSITYYGYVKDVAGNTNKCSLTIKKDETKPTCTVTSNGTEGDNDWYTSNVSVSLASRSDATSGVARYGLTTSSSATYNSSTSATQTNDTKNVTYYGYVADAAGNTNNCSTSFKKDSTKPTCTVSSDGTEGKNDWYTSDVDMSLSSRNDATSGIAGYGLSTSSSATYNSVTASTQTADTKGITYRGYVKDAAGNTNSCSKTIKKDETKPTCTVTANGTEGDNDWYTGNVSISLASRSDATSGVARYGLTTSASATYNSSTSATQTADTTGTTYRGYVEDNAGNTNSCSASVKKDSTKPTCTINLSGTEGEEDWYRSDVGISLGRSDSTSGVNSYGLSTSSSTTYNSTPSLTRTSDTSGTKYYGYVKDNAGNTTSCQTTVKRDTVAPTCSLSASGTEGDNDWYTSDVTVKFSSRSDARSGIADYGLTTSSSASYNSSTSKTQTADTKGITYYGHVKDKAGNTVKCSKSIKKDETSPTINYSLRKIDRDMNPMDVGPAYSNQWSNKEIRRNITADDTTSGLDKVQWKDACTELDNSCNLVGRSWCDSTWYDEAYYNGNYYYFGEGVNDAYFRAIDEAGNVSDSIRITMKVDWTAPQQISHWYQYMNEWLSYRDAILFEFDENIKVADLEFQYCYNGTQCGSNPNKNCANLSIYGQTWQDWNTQYYNTGGIRYRGSAGFGCPGYTATFRYYARDCAGNELYSKPADVYLGY